MQMKKTAMQQVYELLKSGLSPEKVVNYLLIDEELMLEKEKEIMCQFQEDGQSTDFWVKYDSWEDCFDKTFNTKEQ
jgi:hypothetical protein